MVAGGQCGLCGSYLDLVVVSADIFLEGLMAEKTWKRVERKIARFFGAERNPLSGENSKHSRSDSLHERLFIETKHRKYHSAVTLWRETKEKAKKEGKTPVICLAEKHKNGFWVMCHSDDLETVSNEIKKA